MLTQAVRDRTGDRTSFRAGTLGRHDHTTSSVHVLKCVPLRSVEMFGKCETTRCGELPRHAFFACPVELPIHTSKIDRHFLYSKRRTPGLTPSPETTLCTLLPDNDEKDGRPLKYMYTCGIKLLRYLITLFCLFLHCLNL
jgi:hypothetical protein